jgi:hypothetical protein
VTTLVASVRSDHAAILKVLGRLEKAAAKYPLGEHAARKASRRLVALESRHEAAEAAVLWPVVRDRLPECSRARADAVAQEHNGRLLLHHLGRSIGRRPQMTALVPELSATLRAHIALEEGWVLGLLERRLEASEALRLGAVFRQASAAAPTRPHPYLPDIPGVIALVSPLARRVDRVRDLLRLP